VSLRVVTGWTTRVRFPAVQGFSVSTASRSIQWVPETL
jgi:hypothetical protein